MRRTSPQAAAPDTGVSAGLLVASGIVPGTFARSLSVRSAADQGIITGLSTGLHYLLTVGTQDALQAAVAEFAGAKDRRGRQRNLTLLADLAVIPAGLALQRALPPRPGEPMARGLLRQTGWRLVLTGAAATLSLAAQAGTRTLDTRLGAGGRMSSTRSEPPNRVSGHQSPPGSASGRDLERGGREPAACRPAGT